MEPHLSEEQAGIRTERSKTQQILGLRLSRKISQSGKKCAQLLGFKKVFGLAWQCLWAVM